jgi:hypothetical protein
MNKEIGVSYSKNYLNALFLEKITLGVFRDFFFKSSNIFKRFSDIKICCTVNPHSVYHGVLAV